MLQCIQKYPTWVVIISFLVLFGASYGLGWLVAWSSAGDPEDAVALASTGAALVGAILGGIGASLPVVSQGKRERSAGVELDNKLAARDIWSTFGWAFIILGAAMSFLFQLSGAFQTFAKLIPYA